LILKADLTIPYERHRTPTTLPQLPTMRRTAGPLSSALTAQGVAGRPNPLAGWPGFMSVWPTASCTHVYTRRGRPRRWRKSVEVKPHGQLDMSLGRPAITWQVIDLTKLVTPPWTPYKYPSTGGNQDTHHILEISHAKLSFLV
jgi:hypothetical protein